MGLGGILRLTAPRALARLALRLSPVLCSLGLCLWALSSSPFATPFVAASQQAAERALALALADTVTQEWYDQELARALSTEDFDRVGIVALTGARHGIGPSAEQLSAINALEAKTRNLGTRLRGCGQCMADIAQCPSLPLLATCGITVELTPLGDLNALRRAGVAAARGEQIDEIDVTLALVGIGATGAAFASGGSSLTVKAGATALRLARRLGTLTPRFAGELARLSRVDLRPRALPDYVLGRVPIDAVVDTAKLAALSAVATDLTRVARNTSLADTVHLMRHVETTDDAARLARLSDLAGDQTRPILDVLGKGRVFRALIRLGDLAITAGALILLLLGQVAAAIGGLLSGRVLRRLTGYAQRYVA